MKCYDTDCPAEATSRTVIPVPVKGTRHVRTMYGLPRCETHARSAAHRLMHAKYADVTVQPLPAGYEDILGDRR